MEKEREREKKRDKERERERDNDNDMERERETRKAATAAKRHISKNYEDEIIYSYNEKEEIRKETEKRKEEKDREEREKERERKRSRRSMDMYDSGDTSYDNEDSNLSSSTTSSSSSSSTSSLTSEAAALDRIMKSMIPPNKAGLAVRKTPESSIPVQMFPPRDVIEIYGSDDESVKKQIRNIDDNASKIKPKIVARLRKKKTVAENKKKNSKKGGKNDRKSQGKKNKLINAKEKVPCELFSIDRVSDIPNNKRFPRPHFNGIKPIFVKSDCCNSRAFQFEATISGRYVRTCCFLFAFEKQCKVS